jgi:hypothetical protein
MVQPRRFAIHHYLLLPAPSRSHLPGGAEARRSNRDDEEGGATPTGLVVLGGPDDAGRPGPSPVVNSGYLNAIVGR